MNYGEELTYWYLRLNGFFPISNFVVHRSEGVEHTSDVDVLAVRPPHVYEEIGGRSSDWDEYLSRNLRFGRHIGLVCEVKTGAFEEAKLFRPQHLRYTLPRLGLVEPNSIDQAIKALKESSSTELTDGAVLAKLLVSATEHKVGFYLNRTLPQIEDFLADRVRRYPAEKFAPECSFRRRCFNSLSPKSTVQSSNEKRPNRRLKASLRRQSALPLAYLAATSHEQDR